MTFWAFRQRYDSRTREEPLIGRCIEHHCHLYHGSRNDGLFLVLCAKIIRGFVDVGSELNFRRLGVCRRLYVKIKHPHMTDTMWSKYNGIILQNSVAADIPGCYLIFDDKHLFDTVLHGVVSMSWSITELSHNTRTIRLDSIRVFDTWEIDRLGATFYVGFIVKQTLLGESTGPVLQITGADIRAGTMVRYNYTAMHPRDGDKYWLTAAYTWLTKNVHQSLVGILRPLLDESEILRSARKIFNGMPDDAWHLRVQQILQSETPPGPSPWTDPDGPNITRRLVAAILASDVEGSLNFVWWIVKKYRTFAPMIGTAVQGGPRPRATEHNLLELVTRWTGFVRPSVAGPACLVDDLALPGVDEDRLYADPKKYHPGVWKVTYRYEPQSRFGCVVQSVQDVTTGQHADHRDPRVMHQVFRRYVLCFYIFQHTQSHVHNVIYGELARRCLHVDDPVRLMAEECTSMHGTIEHIVGDLIFFHSSVDEQKQKQQYLGKFLGSYAQTDSTYYYNIPQFVPKVLSCYDNFAEKRRLLYQNPAILRFSPVMQYMRDFHVVCDRFLQQVQRHEDLRLTAGRQDLVRACRTFGDNAPHLRPAPATPVQLLSQIFHNVLQHQYSHTALTHSDTHTTSLFLTGVITDEAWAGASAEGGVLAFGHVPTNSIQAVEPPLFGRRFQAVLRQYPQLSDSVRGFLAEIRSLSDRASAGGIYVFKSMQTYIDR